GPAVTAPANAGAAADTLRTVPLVARKIRWNRHDEGYRRIADQFAAQCPGDERRGSVADIDETAYVLSELLTAKAFHADHVELGAFRRQPGDVVWHLDGMKGIHGVRNLYPVWRFVGPGDRQAAAWMGPQNDTRRATARAIVNITFVIVNRPNGVYLR
ncbi:MAG: hypothetical protein Q8J99_20675, partial [Sulfuritalea sp.]|nr:hypothetical protein [Sulfuritalea sp.]